ncbi:galactose oxidase [Trametes coccinea BRFM310]|uniref:Galactose oxidase n=1 Tax=Trametes coccinea (strain BRFM310) TaxID=1353009 RepID=A0A1Y2IYM0_TRAC3|nr:galactose oxidase [Trametes coccinea BRFM310]
MARGRWTLISRAGHLARSSHCASVAPSGRLIVYGGELKPRTPVDAGDRGDPTPSGSLHVMDMGGGLLQKWALLFPAGRSAAAPTSIPEARVGATMVWYKDALYMWGGRGGPDMIPLDPHQVGVWKATIEFGQDPHGELGSVLWERIAASNEEQAPESRSYHTAVAYNDKLYVHAGCPATGRLSTLHAFDLKERMWEALTPGPEPGRGGTCLVATAISGAKDVLLRYGGFCGHELPDTAGAVDIYSITENRWSTVQPAADPVHGCPGPRSVHGFVRFQSTSKDASDAVAVLYHGERDASKLGHAGAGSFWDDVWLLTKAPEADDLLSGWAWRRVDVGGGSAPEGRGWFPSASWVDPDGNTRVVLFGGLLSSNTRSDELWELHID